MDNYDFELGRIIKEIKKTGAKEVGLQFPEGLKTYATEVAGEIEEKTGATTVIFVDPVYGACDTKENEARLLGLDLVVHFGHTDLAPDIRRK
jgi:2-(3-amino-3-carboxypropyl)histidine synthase